MRADYLDTVVWDHITGLLADPALIRAEISKRLEAARSRILEGEPLAAVAADVGFVDQAHLTRRFRDFLGTTPAAFRRPSTRG